MIWAIHGNLGEAGDWREVRESLPGTAFLTADLWKGPILPFREWAQDWNQSAVGDGEAVLLGYSLGARLAMHALLERPSLWKAAIFVSAHPGLRTSVDRDRRLLEDAAWSGLLETGDAGSFLDQWNTQETLKGEPVGPEQRERLTEHRQAIAAAFRTWSLGAQEDLRPLLTGCSVPQLWIAGAEDRKFAELMRKAAAQIPTASYREVEGSGHRVPLRNPRGLSECVRHFLVEQNLNP